MKTSDLVGLDVRLSIAEALASRLSDERFAPPGILRRLVAKGRTGKKSGRGFYRWEGETAVAKIPRPEEEPMNDRRTLTLGIVIALVGGFFLLRRSVELSGPAPILLLLGAIFLALSALRSFRGPLLPAGVLLGLGAGFLLSLRALAPAWATLARRLGGVPLVASRPRRRARDPGRLVPGHPPRRWPGAALARQLNFAAFFERLAFLWPWLLGRRVVLALRRSA